ncbi:Hypothetical protein NTJ_11267 [Nesidiocoris tenuis]|uniref:Chitin-binding type-2 domain-containing protein n=1 Tax=Nesidiocoris tenuis TaxID=355587 RepID=A0ABN7B6Q5_9HEMI|nr:Hypothetical protein NTJ_11267 [Nesidiocoris tenuis]
MKFVPRAATFLLVPVLASSAVWYQPLTSTTTEIPESPRIVAANGGNYSISFVPLITLLAGMIPRIVSRFRNPISTNAREIEPKQASVPMEFNGANPCIDSILVRRPYPGNACFFYQCELIEPSTATCRLQVLQDPDSPTRIDYKTVERKSSLVRISDCLAIRLYRCSPGHVYSKANKVCMRTEGRYYGEDSCVNS